MILPWVYFLQEDEQLLIEAFTQRWTVNGPRVCWTAPFWKARRLKGITLGPTHYLRVRNTLTGELRNERGPKLFFPTAHDEVVKQLEAIPLKHHQYICLIDNQNGVMRDCLNY